MIIAITGCMAQKNQAEMFKRAPHIDIVLGTHNIQHINEMIEEVTTRSYTSNQCRHG